MVSHSSPLTDGEPTAGHVRARGHTRAARKEVCEAAAALETSQKPRIC